MQNYLEKDFKRLYNDIVEIEKNYKDFESILQVVKERIIDTNQKYFLTDNSEEKESLKDELLKEYDLLYYYQSKKNGVRKAYLLDSDIENLPDVYLIDQKPERFDLDENIINTIQISEGLTLEQAEELLKWTVNNTRDNLNTGIRINKCPKDVYDNYSLMGYCGFSQFSSLYPLQQLGLEVTINNIGEIKGGRHAYGTVVIPIKDNNKIVNKRFLIDCTYRQFFTVEFNSFSRYINSAPDIGFFIKEDKEKIEFAKELLKNGFIELTQENLEHYLKPFFMRDYQLENIEQAEEDFAKVDLLDAIQNRQVEFDYEASEFDNWGCNLKLSSMENSKIL